jgi:RNA polymerase sigma-70 factor (ECF subfamily)
MQSAFSSGSGKRPGPAPKTETGAPPALPVCVPAQSPQPVVRSLENLVHAIARGEQAAFSSLYQQTVAQVFAIARCMLRSKEDAEEIVCDVYTFAWQRASAFDPKRGSVMAWLAVMTRNRAVDRLRQRRATLSLDDERQDELYKSLVSDTLGPDQILAQFQSGSAVHRALSALSEQRRRLIGLAFFQGLTHEEIAVVVGMPLGTVKSHVRRALTVLQGELSTES